MLHVVDGPVGQGQPFVVLGLVTGSLSIVIRLRKQYLDFSDQ